MAVKFQNFLSSHKVGYIHMTACKNEYCFMANLLDVGNNLPLLQNLSPFIEISLL